MVVLLQCVFPVLQLCNIFAHAWKLQACCIIMLRLMVLHSSYHSPFICISHFWLIIIVFAPTILLQINNIDVAQVSSAARLNVTEKSMFEVWQPPVEKLFQDMVEFLRWNYSNNARLGRSLFLSVCQDLLIQGCSFQTSDLMAFLKLLLWNMSNTWYSSTFLNLYIRNCSKQLLLVVLAYL